MESKFFVCILVVFFGSSSWLTTNSIWMQLPFFVQNLPEKWSLPSYLAAIVQIACIGPLIYSIIYKCIKISIPQAPIILCLLIICSLTTLAIGFLWQETGVIFGNNHSLGLFILTFIVAIVNSTSNVLFLPYLASFHSSYLTAYFTGMGLSALVPSIVSLIQGNLIYNCVLNSSTMKYDSQFISLRFSVRTFNIIMFIWMCLTTVSFIILHRCVPIKNKSIKTDQHINNIAVNNDEITPFNNVQIINKSNSIRYWIFLILLGWICAQMNSIIPSIQSYASLSYSLLTYHLNLAFSNIAQPIASFILFFYKPKNTTALIFFYTLLMTSFTLVIFILALQSPEPLLQTSFFGSAISIFVSVASVSLGSFLRTVITSVIFEDFPHSSSKLFGCGAIMQIGSFLGACIIFPLVNVFSIFRSANLC